MKFLCCCLLPLLSLPFRRRSPGIGYTPVDASFVERYPWLRVSYFRDGTLKAVMNPFRPDTVLQLDYQRPCGRADRASTFQLYTNGQLEQFGPWDEGGVVLESSDWRSWVQTWIEAIAQGTSACRGRAVEVTDFFVGPDRSLYRPIYPR